MSQYYHSSFQAGFINRNWIESIFLFLVNSKPADKSHNAMNNSNLIKAIFMKAIAICLPMPTFDAHWEEFYLSLGCCSTRNSNIDKREFTKYDKPEMKKYWDIRSWETNAAFTKKLENKTLKLNLNFTPSNNNDSRTDGEIHRMSF